MADLTDTIEEAAQDPASASSDGQSATARPIADLIAADRYLKGQQATESTNAQGGPRSGWGALRAAKAIPPGGA